MPDVLDFDPNRHLGFDLDRDLSFDSGRALTFDSSRDLGFHVNRDLGFGKKGVVFRGFVCPVCGASVTETDPSCTNCGATFEKPKTPRIQPPRAAAAPNARSFPPPPTMPPPPPPPPVRYPMPPKRIDAHNCPVCGARLSTTDTFCWNCGNRVYAGPGR